MKTKIIQIGNSQGIRIPKPLIKQCNLQGEVELEIHDNEIVIRAPHSPRQGWANKFASMAAKGDDSLLDTETQSTWDGEEWEWK